MQLISPCTYQGGKQRLAAQIVSHLLSLPITEETQFYDLCCGSGAVTLALIQQGIHPKNIHMVDSGGFGWFWETLAHGSFDIKIFKEELDKLPSIDKIQKYLQELSLQPIHKTLGVYHYLMLQAGAFGGKQIGIKNSYWTNTSFRNYWLPTPTSNRRSPVNPMMPLPTTLYERVDRLVHFFEDKQLHAYYMSIDTFITEIGFKTDCIIYMDPPYQNTTRYENKVDYIAFLNTYRNQYPIFISEGIPLADMESYLLSTSRKKGNISGAIKKASTLEYLNKSIPNLFMN